MCNTTALRMLILFSSLIVLASCAKTPDVRLTLCQDLTQLLLNSPEGLQWQEHKAIIKAYQDLEMQLEFTTNEQSSTAYASCFYSYVQDEIGAETFQDPEAAYDTYPNKMVLKGEEVDKMLLSRSINSLMQQQGKTALNKVKTELEQASKKAIERIQN